MPSVRDHYEQEQLVERIRAALELAGLAENFLTLEQLAPIDHFHSRGIAGTEEMAGDLKVCSGDRMLDLGSGLGGPARYFARKFDCHVQGIDLTQSFVDAAKFLTVRAGLSSKVTFDCGDATALPYTDASFDVVVTQHVAMNIKNKDRLYSEAYRVLKPGGQFALYDIVAGERGSVHFPVPWSDGLETSFLVDPMELRDLLEEQGFKIVGWKDHTDQAIEWFAEIAKKQAELKDQNQVPFNIGVVMGPGFGARAANLTRSLKEDKAGVLEVIAIKE